ncbi:MAG: hypothetical protein LBK94_06640 [Prevotellaceae bacterium]|jgi:hypothetical protein|nr:hypothetical protein [Prevotellaceae bacterium]
MEKNNGIEIIERTGDLLMVNKTGIIKMVKDNSDRNSAKIDCSLITMINCFYGHLSVKQMSWILEKVKYIIRHNKKYIEYKGIKDIQFC